VDGRPAPVLAANYVIQAVPVPRGTHVVELAYDDPWIGYGLLGSALFISGLVGAAAWFGRRRRTVLVHEGSPSAA
jgi:hypothetical protein